MISAINTTKLARAVRSPSTHVESVQTISPMVTAMQTAVRNTPVVMRNKINASWKAYALSCSAKKN